MKIPIPYGKSNLICEVEDSALKGVLYSRSYKQNTDYPEVQLVIDALKNPIASQKLRDLAKGKRRVTVVTSDHTRPVPSMITMPILLEEIRNGNPDAEITILVATGMHRDMTMDEIRTRFGENISTRERIIVHDSRDTSGLAFLGKLPSGGDLVINQAAVACDLLVAEGFIEPHFFAGFSGGRKAILPGIAGYDTVLANHCAEFIAHDRARTGIMDGNPIHDDMIYAAKTARLSFILNVVLNAQKNIIAAFAGDMEAAHRKGCGFLAGLASVKSVPADIVITGNGGYPLDQNMYQTVKCMTAAEASAKEGAVIIVAAECCDGHGGEAFYDTFAGSHSPEEVMRAISKRRRGETFPDQWQIQIFVRILMKHKIIMVAAVPSEMILHMGMIPAKDIKSAIKTAKYILKKDNATITVIPDGVSVIVKK